MAGKKEEFPSPRPLLARLTTKSGPPRARVFEGRGARVMAVPCRYSVTYILLGRRDLAVVDVGSIGDVPRILEALRWLGRAPGEVRHVVPSHLHFDHMMGVDAMARRVGATVTLSRPAHEAVTGSRQLRFPVGRRHARSLVTWPMQGMPVLPLEDWVHGLDFGVPWGKNRFSARLGPILDHESPVPGLDGWIALHAPGHSDDSMCLYHAEAGFLVGGDVIRNFYGGEWNPLSVDDDAFARSRSMLRALDVGAAFPGHGPVIEGAHVVRRLVTVGKYMP